MERSLRIAMLSVHSCPLGRLGEKDTGGMSVYIRELAVEMGRRGHLIDIYTREHGLGEDEVTDLGENVRLIHLRAGDEGEMHKLMLYPHLAEFACNVENFRKADGARYDLIHSHYWLSGWVGDRLQHWWQVPHVTMFHTLGRVKNATRVGEEETELRLQTEVDIAERCQRIIAATPSEKDDLVAVFGAAPEAVSVIPCGVNFDRFQPLDRDTARQRLGLNGEQTLLFVGRIDPLKGIENLLGAFSALGHLDRRRLIIVGGDDRTQAEVDHLKELAARLRIQEAVMFVGSVPQEELPAFYSAADGCVMPSYYESFGLVVLESLACGTPVIATRVGGAEGVIRQGENGYLVDSNSPSHLLKAMTSLLSAQGVASSPDIRESIAGYSWPGIARSMLDEYHKTISRYHPVHLASSR